MTGHGCPIKVSNFYRVMTILLAFALAPIDSQLQVDAQEPLSAVAANLGGAGQNRSIEKIRLRFSWGGGVAQTWNGKISVTQGTFSKLTPLGLTPDAPAAVQLVDGELKINHWSSTSYGGVDVELEASLDSQISFRLTSIENPDASFEETFSFEQLVSETVGGAVDELGNRCSVSRAPGDLLPVEINRKHLVFSPGESFQFLVRPNLTGISSRAANCRVRIVPAHRSGIRVSRLAAETLSFQIDANGSAEPQEINLTVPEEESVYNIELELEPIWYQTSFVSKRVVIQRNIQFIVLSDQPPPISDRLQWREFSVIDPVDGSQPAFAAWSQFSRLTGRPAKEMIGNDLRAEVVVDQQKMMQLAPGGWQAIPLSVDQVGKPHVIELEYVSQGEMAVGLSLLQPDEMGQIPPYGFDGGIFVPQTIVNPELNGVIRRHRLTIWPRTKTPYLLVANRHTSRSATIGKVRVLSGLDRLEPDEIAKLPARKMRKLMAFYEAPLFPENFGAREAVDAAVAEPLDDWRTFYEGADRLVEYLKSNSYRGAFITVAANGSSIYPSQLLSASPKHDNGVFFSTGQDPIRKDVLEMLFRMFEREQLLLVPTLALSGPITEVEETRKRDGSVSEFELTDLNRTLRRTATGGSLPIYNPLNRKVQRSVTRVVEELSTRYQGYSSFDGVALICRPDTYTLLPGRQWGYDAATIRQFIQSQPELGPVPTQWPKIQRLLLGSHRKQWIDWRAQQMQLWYEAMAGTVRGALPKGKLYLAPVDLYQNDELASALSPSLHATSNFEELMQHMGFTKPLFCGPEQADPSPIVLLNPHRLTPDQTLASQRVDLGVENSKQAQQFFSQASYAGDLFTHRIAWAHFEQLQAQSPFGKQGSPLMRLQQMTPAAQFNRQRFVQSIKDRDSRMLVDGGWMISMGEEAEVRDLMSVFGQLPDVRFVDVKPNQFANPNALPVAVRQHQSDQANYFYVANASPWPIQVVLQVESDRQLDATSVVSLSQQGFAVKPADNSPVTTVSQSRPNRPLRFVVSMSVPPYGLIGGRSDGGAFNIADFEFELPAGADKDLRKRVYALQSKLIKSNDVQPYDVIDNSTFEVDGKPSLAGWDSAEQSTENIRLMADQSPAGVSAQSAGGSLVMTNREQQAVWVRSNTFAPPETGRLSISVWLKTEDPANQPPLRLAVEGQLNGSSYYRFGSVGRLSPDQDTNQLESRWKRFAVHFDDLPMGGLQNLRIGFDLMGPGQVSIDNVQVFDRWFDENDAKAITQILASTGPLLARPESFDTCRRLLEAYWTRFLDVYVVDEEPARIDAAGESKDMRQVGESKNRQAQVQQIEKQNEEPSATEQVNGAPKKSSLFRRFRGFGPQRKSP